MRPAWSGPTWTHPKHLCQTDGTGSTWMVSEQQASPFLTKGRNKEDST